jgi:S1-C subfamily serine protease
MRPWFFAALVLLLLPACPKPEPVTPGHVTEAAGLAAKTIALIKVDEETGNAHPYCSGVWVSPTVIVTAAHCVDEDTSVALYVTQEDVFDLKDLHQREKAKAHYATLLALDEDHDLALYVSPAPAEHPYATISSDEVKVGSFAQAMGHSLGLWFSYSSGDVASVRQVDLDLDIVWIQATTPISPGNSGGGLFDARGELIGIASRTLTGRAQGLNFFVHWRYVRDLLAKNTASLGSK